MNSLLLAVDQSNCSVTVVEMDSLPLRRVLGDEVAMVYRDLHVAHGVDFRFGAGLSEFRGEDGHVTGVLLADGTVLPADLVAVGVGIRSMVDTSDQFSTFPGCVYTGDTRIRFNSDGTMTVCNTKSAGTSITGPTTAGSS